ncbi:MAG: glycosyltransferase family 39 protein, partial [Bryobacteraceae bacterium]
MAILGTPARNLKRSQVGSLLILWLRLARDSFEQSLSARWQAVALPILTVLLFAAVVAFSGARKMWNDELFTFYIAQAPSLGQMFHEIRLDLNPPLEYLAVRGSLSVFGSNEYAARLPSMLAFFVASASLYWFMARRLSSAYGVLAVAVLWSTPFLYYATEARPYALVLAFFGIAMLAWVYRAETRRPKAALTVLALAVCGMMFSHFFAVFYLLPLGLAELVRGYRKRKIDFPVWAALIVP